MFEIKSLKKTYHNSDGDALALKGLDFKVGNSGVVFLFGQSGEGKSTLLNIMSGLDNYDKGGKVLYNGKDIMEMSQRERDIYRSKEIGLIFEKENYVDCLTVRENVELAILLCGNKVDKEIVDSALEKVGLAKLASRRLSELSSGELQRIAIARILAAKPKVLFVDEPTGHLDKENSETFWSVVKNISKTTLVVAITHEREIVENYADRVIELKQGEIVKDRYLNASLKKADENLFKEEVEHDKMHDIDTNLDFKTSMKLGWRFLVKAPLRFMSMVVLILFALVMFSTTYLVQIFDASSVLAESTIEQGLTYVTFQNSAETEIANDVLEKIYTSNTGEYFHLHSTNQALELFDTEIVFTGQLEVIQAPDSDTNWIGQKVIYGRYPLGTDPNNRIAISDYFAALMIRHGVTYYLRDGEGVLNSSSSRRDIIGKSFIIDGTKFEVCAIYETNYRDYVNEDLTVKAGCEEDFEYYNKTVYSLMHIVPSKSTTTFKINESASNVNLAIKSEKVELLPNLYETIAQDYANSNGIAYGEGYNIFGNKLWLTENEVVLPIRLFNRLYKSEMTEIADEAFAEFQSIVGDNSKITISSKYGFTQEYTIVGLTTTSKIIFANNSVSIKGRFGEISQHCVSPILHIVVPVVDSKTLATQIQLLADNGLIYTGRYAEEILDLTDLVSDLRSMFTMGTSFIVFFSVWLMFTFFVTFATSNRRSIGALRTMGANSIDIFTIFIISCIIMAGTGMVLGMLSSIASSAVLNGMINSMFVLPIKVFNLDGAMFGYMALMTTGITFLGCLTPILIYCRKTPVDVVKR